LGSGYYFWDDHIDLAHWWGENHCNDDYIVCEANFRIEKKDFCDLVGSRQDQEYMIQLLDKLNANNLNLGQFIELLKDLESRPQQKGIFNFKAIRAVEAASKGYPEMIVKFSHRTTGITSLTPKILVCLIRKDPAILKNYKIVFPEEFTN